VKPQELLDKLANACRGGMTAVRVVTHLAPVGGDADKVFPPTYEGGKYATEKRRVDGQEVEAVLLDSVQSQANRLEAALLEAFRQGECPIPLLQVAIPRGQGDTVVTALDAPHRAFDAIFRDSLLGGKKFRDSPLGKRLVAARPDDATALFEACPTALIFGVWDSTGGRGVTGVKVARAVISEIVGLNAVYGRKSSSRIDPLAIPRDAAVIYCSEADLWTLSPGEAIKDKKGNPEKFSAGRPSDINHSNFPPSVSKEGEPGGVTISEALQTTVLSFPQLRRLRFPDPGSGNASPERDLAGRAVLAALALYAIARQREEGYSLRSRCHLVPVEPARHEFLGSTAKDVEEVDLTLGTVRDALAQAVKQAGKVGLTWREGVIELEPAGKLVELVRRGDEKATVGGGE
jgi:CRISPR-associated protein Csb1